MVLVDTYAINVRNPFWGPNSEEYDPSRFKNVKSTDVSFIYSIQVAICTNKRFSYSVTVQPLRFWIRLQKMFRAVLGRTHGESYPCTLVLPIRGRYHRWKKRKI